MRLASKGLGKITLPFRFTEARISEARDFVVFEGRIKEKKVNWTYRAELEDADLFNFVVMARNPAVVAYLAERAGLGLFGRAARSALRLILHPLRRASPAPTDAQVTFPPPPATTIPEESKASREAL